MKNLLSALFAASLLPGLPLAARADSVTFTLTSPTQNAAVGTAADFQATITAPSSNGAAEYINGDAINFYGPGTIDDTAFENGFFLLETLSPGQTATSGLFAIDLPANATLGSYSGTFELLGGATINSQDMLGTVAFTVNATPATSPAVTPEPASLVLLGSGALSMLAAGWRRRRSCGNDASIG